MFAKMIKKKDIKLSKLKKLKKKIKSSYEREYYFISFKLINIKKKKKYKTNTVKYLKTTRYVIPLPSEEEHKIKKWKILLSIKTNLLSVYKYYDEFFERQLYLLNFSFITTYNPGRLGYLTKFDNNLKLEILFCLNNVFRLFTEGSFSKNYLWKYYSQKKFKYYSLVFFWDMFDYFWNPNLPLKRQKGERYLTKTQGSALMQAREIIFKELAMENLGIAHFFSDLELQIFWKAGLDPFDKRYHWPTRWLFILNISSHDGRIVKLIPNQFKKKIWSKNFVFSTWVLSSAFLNLKKKFLLQIFFWKKLFFKFLSLKKFFFNFKKKIKLNFLVPDYYYGYKSEFLKIYFFSKKNKFYCKYTYLNFFWKKTTNNFFDLKKIWFFKKNQSLSNVINYFFSDKKFKLIKITNKLQGFNSKIWKIKQKSFFPIPTYFKIFIFFFLKNKNFLFEEILFYKFITKLNLFSTIKKKIYAQANTHSQPFRLYLTFADKYKLSDPTLAYWIFKLNLLKQPNRDFLILKPQHYGLNPFYKFSKILLNNDVYFTEAVNLYNYYKFLKKIKINKIKKWLPLNLNRFLIFSLEKTIYSCLNNPISFVFLNFCFFKFFLQNLPYNNKKTLFFRACLFLNIELPFFFTKNIREKNYKNKLNYIDFFNDALLELKLYPEGWISPLRASLKRPKKNDIASKKLYWIQTNYLQRWADKSKTYYLINTMYPFLKLNFFLRNQLVTNSVTFIENYQNIFYIQSLSLLQDKFFFLPNTFSLYSESFYHYIWLYYCLKHMFITLPPFIKLKLKSYV